MGVFIFVFNFFKVLPFFAMAHMIGVIFGFFDDQFFTYESVVYGILGNSAYSLFQIFQYLGDETGDVKPLSKKRLMFISLRPLVAGIASFIFSAVLVALFSAMGGNMMGFIKNNATALVVGITSGLFFDHLTSKEFLTRFFKNNIEDKIIKDK